MIKPPGFGPPQQTTWNRDKPSSPTCPKYGSMTKIKAIFVLSHERQVTATRRLFQLNSANLFFILRTHLTRQTISKKKPEVTFPASVTHLGTQELEWQRQHPGGQLASCGLSASHLVTSQTPWPLLPCFQS